MLRIALFSLNCCAAQRTLKSWIMAPPKSRHTPILRRWWLSCLCICAFAVLNGVLSSDVLAVERAYVFSRVNADDDLAQNTVNALLQDRSGFIWIATQGGLHRFDGYRFIAFQHSPEDPSSLPDNFVTALSEDAAGRLWVGTNAAGLARLDRASGDFISVPLKRSPSTENQTPISSLLSDPARGLWIGDHTGVSLLDAAGQLQSVLSFESMGAPTREVRALALAADGALWVASTAGLWIIESATLQAKQIEPQRFNSSNSVTIARDGSIWVGSHDGLFVRRADRAFERVWPTGEIASEQTDVFGIAEAADGRIWAAVFGAGMVVVEPKSGAIERLRSDGRVAGSLPEESIRTLMTDHSGLLWVGGYVYGVARVDPLGARFRLLLDDDPSKPAVETNNTRSLFEDEQGRLLIGTDGDGLKRYDFGTRQFTNLSPILHAALPAKERDSGLRVFAIDQDQQGRYWLGTSVGAFMLDAELQSAAHLSVYQGEIGSGTDRYVRAITVARDGAIWMGTATAGLARYSPQTQEWTRFIRKPGDANSLWHNSVLTLKEDRAGHLWIGTFDGLNVYQPGSGMLRRLPRAAAASDTQAGNLIRVIYQTADDSIFIGSHDGLSQLLSLDGDKPRFRRWLVADGMPSNTIYGIAEDAAGALWLSTNRGVVRFDREHNRFRSYTQQDGLQGLEFNGGAHRSLRDGRIAFGGLQGINLFDPRGIGDSLFEPKVVLTAYQTDQHWQTVMQDGGPAHLRLAPHERLVSFEFAALDFAAPTRNQFEYQLQGFDERWVPLGTRHQVSFTNLDPGEYQLRVRGSNRDQRFSPALLSIDLSVATVWWFSSSMRMLYLVLALILLVSIFLLQRRRMRHLRAHTDALHEREERLRVAIWGSGDEFWDWDMRRGVLFRIGADSLLGHPQSETVISGNDWRARAVHPDDLPQVERILAEHVAGTRAFFESEHRVKNARGDYIWVLSRGKIVAHDENGQPLRVAGTARDITDRRAAESDKRIAEEVIRSMREAVTVTDLKFRFSSVNPAFTRMTGYTEAEILGLPTSILDPADPEHEVQSDLRTILETRGHWHGEVWQRRKNGENFLCWLELSEVVDAKKRRANWVGVLTDITDRKRAEKELRYLANYDTLTGLPNRALLGERLKQAFQNARAKPSRLALLFLDLDRFKHINDSMGHAAGDRLLKSAAARIRQIAHGAHTVARLSGDEFTVLLEDLAGPTQAEDLARALLEAFMRPLDLDGQTQVVISTSIGIALYPDHGQSPADLLKFADTAMYRAKENGRNTYQLYTDAMEAKARLHARMLTQLHRAIEFGEFSLVFQPKLRLADRRITGVEALLRWNNAELGEVSPANFIGLAEETGLIVPIGEWVLRSACEQVARWMAAGIDDITMAVNVSMLQLLRGELFSVMQVMLAEYAIPPDRIELELTESMVMANAEQSISTLTQIKSLGVRLAVDDFGTGYSSLSYLKRLPIDTLKIDKDFVGDISTDPDDEAITATIINMAHSMELRVIAEGVETLAQLEFLQMHGCDEAQGYLISPPLTAANLMVLLVQERERILKSPEDFSLPRLQAREIKG